MVCNWHLYALLALFSIYLNCFRYTDGKTVAFLEECAFLDPRFKSLSWLPESKQQQVHSRILALIAEEMDCQLAQIEMAESGETTAQSSETDPDIAIAG